MRGSTFQTPIKNEKAQVDEIHIVSGMIWTSQKPVVLLGNVWNAVSTGTGTTNVPLAVEDMAEATVDEEGAEGEATQYNTMDVLVCFICFVNLCF